MNISKNGFREHGILSKHIIKPLLNLPSLFLSQKGNPLFLQSGALMTHGCDHPCIKAAFLSFACYLQTTLMPNISYSAFNKINTYSITNGWLHCPSQALFVYLLPFFQRAYPMFILQKGCIPWVASIDRYSYHYNYCLYSVQRYKLWQKNATWLGTITICNLFDGQATIVR